MIPSSKAVAPAGSGNRSIARVSESTLAVIGCSSRVTSATENNAALSLSGLITRRKNLTAASFSKSRAIRTLDELSNNIASRIGDSLRARSLIVAALPSIFNSKSVSFRFVTAFPEPSRTETGIGTSTEATLMISSDSSFTAGFAVGVETAVALCTGRLLTDGPPICWGVGVGLGLRRPDCAEELPAKHTKDTKMTRRMRYISSNTIGLRNRLQICLDEEN